VPFKKRDDDSFASAKITFDFARENSDAPRDLFVGDQNAPDFLAPSAFASLRRDAARRSFEFV